jgi:hypothetical protein
MSKYIIEVQINTSQSILTVIDGIADEFTIKEYVFRRSQLSFDKRPGFRYFAEREVEADSMHDAYHVFMKRIMKVTDSMAYFYSQPVSVEFWNILIKKKGTDTAYFSAYKLRPATSMSDYDVIDERLNTIIDKCDEDEELQNVLWVYNNVAKIDGVDYDPASHQFSLCQLVESLADKDDVPRCDLCGQGGYKRTARRDMKSILGNDLYEKLYGGKSILRNRLGHGQLVGSTFLTNQDVEDTILKITERANSKYEIENKVSASMTDRIRGTHVWNGTAYGIEHRSMGLEECLDIQFDTGRQHVQKPINTKTW